MIEPPRYISVGGIIIIILERLIGYIHFIENLTNEPFFDTY